ncbi:MAG: potassium-transporting ATPase subunit KdpA [Acidimicrobiia bacterium]
MTAAGWVQLLGLIVLIVATAPILGRYIANVLEGTPTRLDRVFGPIERLVFRVCRVDPEREQRWNIYAISVLAFSAVSVLFLYLLQRLQGNLPFNPTNVADMTPGLAFNTAVSFVTNTNWQSYYPETQMSHIVQVMGLTVQNFVSAAVGIAVMAALIRGMASVGKTTLGNFWADLVKIVFRVLLPLAFVGALALVAGGAIQNLSGFHTVTTVTGTEQSIPGGPFASQEAIKEIGTNGGGTFNANSAHPFENPTPVTNFLENYALLIIPFSLAFTFGRMVKDKRQGRAVFAVMGVILIGMMLAAVFFEVGGNPRLDQAGADQTVTALSPGGNMEGKEQRFGPVASGIFAASTTNTSTGAVNSMHDSYTPLSGGVAMLGMQLGEVSPGGTGTGLNGLLVFALLSVFIAGLMVGRTPEYLGKKIQASEVKLLVIYILMMPAVLLGFLAASMFVDSVTTTTIFNPGQHGFSEMLYAFSSAANNNGSAFAGITATTEWMNVTLAICMLVGRFFLIVPTLAIAGSLARKHKSPEGPGTFPTHTPLFGVLVIGVIIVVGALTFLPALALGPIVEQLSL